MITAEQKAQWVKALRSGEFKQGTGCLSPYIGTYCCLGVFAKINNLFLKNGFMVDDKTSNLKNQFYLPDTVIPKNWQRVLSRKNDAGESFATIADFIEQVDFGKPV